MLFNSNLFVFLFLPICLLGYFGFASKSPRVAIAWLVAMSCVFYAWFNVNYLLLLAILVVFNYLYGILLSKQFKNGGKHPIYLFLGLSTNLGVLIYFKYANFLITNINHVFAYNFAIQNIILPIGISFFIFQKIAYLVDAYNGDSEEYNFLDFCLFVMYFPQLIAGPIVHHKSLIPQFKNPAIFKLNTTDMAVGIVMFTIGLSKKIFIADTFARMVDPSFTVVQQAWSLSFIEAWVAALGFTLQIYFDFSAYTDMALGLALMIGIRLPVNFNSPYKAVSIIDFWRRWHISLSTFLRDYVYIPLGGNKKGNVRRYTNLFITMLIGGFWHGAAWTFVFWGALHGVYLIINHSWKHIKTKLGITTTSWYKIKLAQLTTFTAVVIAWVAFRAESFKATSSMLKSMIGLHGIALPEKYEAKYALLKNLGVTFSNSNMKYCPSLKPILYIFLVLTAVWLLPNTQQLCAAFKPVLQPKQQDPIQKLWRFIPFVQAHNDQLKLSLSPLLGGIFALAILGAMSWQAISSIHMQNFIYFQF